jgi:hypothetical protein
MTVTEIINKVQFEVDDEGNQRAVLDLSDWEQLVHILKDLESHDFDYTPEETTIEKGYNNDMLTLVTSVYQGLSPEEIDEIEQIAFDRSHFFSERNK